MSVPGEHAAVAGEGGADQQVGFAKLTGRSCRIQQSLAACGDTGLGLGLPQPDHGADPCRTPQSPICCATPSR
jgi:hypothetical protein